MRVGKSVRQVMPNGRPVSRRWRNVLSGAALMSMLTVSVGCAPSGAPGAGQSSVGSSSSNVVPATSPILEIPATVTEPQPESAERSSKPLVIAHRGASAYRPGNTLAAFALAIDLGADIVEPDVVITSDGHAIVRHDNQLDLTTDVAERDEFAGKRTTKLVGDTERIGWFSEDFTLEEIKSLRAIERIPDVRPESARFDGQEEIPTLLEVLELVVTANKRESADIGVYPEVKQASHFRSVGLDLGSAVLADLEDFGFVTSEDNALIQSVEVEVLRELNDVTDLRLVQLFGGAEAPRDQVIKKSGLTFADMATPAGLVDVAEYADGVAVEKNRYIIPLDESGSLDESATTSFVDDAHEASLFVHVYTFRAENQFLPTQFRSAGGDNALGDVVGEIDAFIRAGIDGFFVDHVDLGRMAVPST
jgi:glycerophosphoryl diester phosphodiesterase